MVGYEYVSFCFMFRNKTFINLKNFSPFFSMSRSWLVIWSFNGVFCFQVIFKICSQTIYSLGKTQTMDSTHFQVILISNSKLYCFSNVKTWKGISPTRFSFVANPNSTFLTFGILKRLKQIYCRVRLEKKFRLRLQTFFITTQKFTAEIWNFFLDELESVK